MTRREIYRSGSDEYLSNKKQSEDWSVSLEILLSDSAGKLAFAAFLQDEYSIENLNFLMDTPSIYQNLDLLIGAFRLVFFIVIGRVSRRRATCPTL